VSEEQKKPRLPDLVPYRDAGLGEHLIPLHRWDYVDHEGKPRGKSPRDNDWRRQSYSEKQIAFNAKGGGNTGFRPPMGWIVLDFDPRNAEPSVLDTFELTYGIDLAKYPRGRTGSDGLHAYGRAPIDGSRYREKLDDLPGIEFKGHGKQVVCPGSIHPNGNYYEWLPGPALKDAPMWPPELLDALRKRGLVRGPGAIAAVPDPEPLDRIKACLDQLPVENFRDHGAWIEVGQAVHQASGADPEALALWQTWSAGDPKYADEAESECEKRWPSFTLRADGVGMGTLVELVKQAGGKAPPPARTPAAEVFDVVEAPTADAPLVVSKATPYQTAAAFINRQRNHLRHYNADWLTYDGAAYVELEEATVRSEVYAFLECARVRAKNEDEQWTLVPFNPVASTVSNVVDALEARSHVPRDLHEPPCWLDGEGPAPREIVACRNGLLHLLTGELLPPTPRFFTRNALEFAYDPDAAETPEWLAFLRGLWSENGDSIATLQEVFGYLLTPDTSHQKAFLLLGPPRSGKGTIARVLAKLIGSQNSCAPTLLSLAESFGLQPLIGKQLAIVSDLRLGPKTDRAAIAENLLRITGEDLITANRKYKPEWTGRLSVRFIIMTNEVPRFADASGALANRFVPLVMTESYLGREDLGLINRLLPELPGILNWAIAGWRRLWERGHFVLPEASRELVQQLADAASPVAAFVREECEMHPQAEVEKDVLFIAWRTWCDRNGRHAGTADAFGRELFAALGGKVRDARPRVDGRRVRTYEGIRLIPRPLAAAAPFAEDDDPLFH
jgi:P4 family phage/plasmid primase-like protien